MLGSLHLRRSGRRTVVGRVVAVGVKMLARRTLPMTHTSNKRL